MKRQLTAILVLIANSAVMASVASQTADLALKSTEETSLLKGAVYLKSKGIEMIKDGAYSPDNGVTWQPQPSTPDFDSSLPFGYRRGLYAPFVDPVNGAVITAVLSLDMPGLDPKIVEPPIAEKGYYLRYRVSIDGGKTYLFDKPLVQGGKTLANPFDGIYIGQNGYYIGDGSGDRIIRTNSGRIIIPAQSSVRLPNGELFNPGVGSYNDAMMILGDWQPDNTIQWTSAKFIKGDLARSTRGMIEPTITQMPDGRILAVMRGSNGGVPDPGFELPSYKWFSVSNDDGDSWSAPQPWLYDTGDNFYSPSSVSGLLKLADGRVFWVGNINPTNSEGNNNRYPLVIGEVDPQTLMLVKDSVLTIDSKRPKEAGVNLAHMWMLEDRLTHDIVIIGERNSQDYVSSTPVTYRISVRQQTE